MFARQAVLTIDIGWKGVGRRITRRSDESLVFFFKLVHNLLLLGKKYMERERVEAASMWIEASSKCVCV